jgi:hypothetical protein
MGSQQPFDPVGVARLWWRQQGARDVGVRAVRVGDDTVYPDTLDGWLTAQAWRLGLRDGGAQRLIAREMPVGGMAIDVGAYLGWYSVALARCAGLTGRVIALEPETGNFDLLTRAVGAGRFRRSTAPVRRRSTPAGRRCTWRPRPRRSPHRAGAGGAAHAHLRGQRRRSPRRRTAPRLLKISARGAEVSVLAARAARSSTTRRCASSAP